MDLARFEQECEDIAAEGGEAAHETPALARLREAVWFAQSVQGKDAFRYRSAAIAARTRLDEQNIALATVRAKRKHVIDALDEVKTRIESVRSGQVSRRVSYFDWRRKNPQAAEAEGSVPTAAV